MTCVWGDNVDTGVDSWFGMGCRMRVYVAVDYTQCQFTTGFCTEFEGGLPAFLVHSFPFCHVYTSNGRTGDHPAILLNILDYHQGTRV